MKQLSDEQVARLSPESRAKYENDLRKVNRNRKILFIFGGTVITALVLVVLSMTILFNVTSIKVVEAGKKYTADQILMASGLDVGDNMIRTDFNSAEERIESSLPYILEAKITKKLSGEIKISVKDTAEAIIVDFGTGDFLVTDKNGKALRMLKEYPEDCKLMRIKSTSKVFTTIGSVFKLSKEKESSNYNALKAKLGEVGLLNKITEIDLRDSNYLKVVYEGRLRLLIGSTDDLDTKLKGAAETIAIENENNPTTIAEINLTIPKKVFVNPLTTLDPPEEAPEEEADEQVNGDAQEDVTQSTDDSAQSQETTDASGNQNGSGSNDETEETTETSEETTSTTTQPVQQ